MQRRSFIAGAVCPSCQNVDKIFIEKSLNIQKLECINCSYTATQVLTEIDEEQK